MKLLSRKTLFPFAALLFGLLLAYGFLRVFEAWCDAQLKASVLPSEHYYAENYYLIDQYGLHKPRPNGSFRSYKREPGSSRMIYDITYHTDALSRRITPVDNPEGRPQFAAFFGCSFTYGEGLEDDQTIPYYFAKASPEYVPYNYAFHGASAADMLLKLESADVRKEIPQQKGVLVYIFIDAHMKRLVGSMQIAGSWGSTRPRYVLSKDGIPVHKGTFRTGRPAITWLYRELYKSAIVRYFKIDLPARFSDGDYRLMTAVIKRSRDLFLSRFPGSSFVTVFLPESSLAPVLEPYLDREGIRYLDERRLFRAHAPEYVLSPFDHHPSAKADRIVAEALARDLKDLLARPAAPVPDVPAEKT